MNLIGIFTKQKMKETMKISREFRDECILLSIYIGSEWNLHISNPDHLIFTISCIQLQFPNDRTELLGEE